MKNDQTIYSANSRNALLASWPKNAGLVGNIESKKWSPLRSLIISKRLQVMPSNLHKPQVNIEYWFPDYMRIFLTADSTCGIGCPSCRVSSLRGLCGKLATRIYIQPGCSTLVGQVWIHLLVLKRSRHSHVNAELSTRQVDVRREARHRSHSKRQTRGSGGTRNMGWWIAQHGLMSHATF